MAILPFLLLVLGFSKTNFVTCSVLLKHHNQTDNKWHNKVDGVGNPTFALYRFKNHAYCHKTAQKCAHNTNCYTVPRYINWVLRYFPDFHNGACQYHRNGKQKGKLCRVAIIYAKQFHYRNCTAAARKAREYGDALC